MLVLVCKLLVLLTTNGLALGEGSDFISNVDAEN